MSSQDRPESDAQPRNKSRVEGVDIFKTRFWIFDLSALQPHFPLWRARIAQMRRDSPRPSGRSNRLGWNSETILFRDRDFAPLETACREACGFVFNQMNVKWPIRIRLNAWANVHDRGAYNRDHAHGQALLSGCFYLTAPAGSGALVFNDPRIGATLSPFIDEEINSGHTVMFKPVEGRLVLFPSWLSHHVEAHDSDEPRTAICLNADWDGGRPTEGRS